MKVFPIPGDSQRDMAELFDATKQNISRVDPAATVKDFLMVQIEGGREVQRPVK
jgi:hypothetical protein